MLRGRRSRAYAFQFIANKISDVEITPAQLALDPCMAGCVVTDVKTGEVLALVSLSGLRQQPDLRYSGCGIL